MLVSPCPDATAPRARWAPWLLGVLGVAAVWLGSLRPWRDPELPIGPVVLVVMAVVGVGILSIATVVRPRLVRRTALALGATVAAYPLLLVGYGTRVDLAIGAAELAPVLEFLARSGHIAPLVLIQLLPLLACRAVTGAPTRWWPGVVLGANAADFVLVAMAHAVPSLAAVALPAGMLLWLGSAGIAPLGTWLAVRGTTGQTRRRAVLIATSSVVSVLILAFCGVLGLAEGTLPTEFATAVALLLIGFSTATVLTAWLAMVATGDGEHRLLRTTALGRVLATVLLAFAMLLASAAALTAISAGVSAGGAVLLAIAVMAATGLALGRLHRWTVRFVDPAGELRQELGALGDPADGRLRLRTEQVLRSLVADPGLRLLTRPDDGAWLDSSDQVVDAAPPEAVALALSARPATIPLAVACPTTVPAAHRLRRFGDCTSLMWAAVLEGEVARERQRTSAAAAIERERLRRDLHDGLQSRLLGIALNLQLAGRQSHDAVSRLLIEDTVTALRGAAEEARCLADGGLPDALVRHGLHGALDELVGPITPLVSVDLPDGRLPPDVESAAYFVVGEAVGNAIKHAEAADVRVRVEASAETRTVRVVVADDGVGGADPRAGTGLRRLAERVAASGGILVVREAVPHGTVVEASLPCVW